ITPSGMPQNRTESAFKRNSIFEKIKSTYFLTSSKFLNLYKKILSDIEGIKIDHKNHSFSEDKTINLGKFFLYNQKYAIHP
ncbi:MAG: hypothetical protein MUO55_01410, partial [Candidatus Atribacteria bacterium]|nr:hypothetical protein [Candidatus Atribacteria bacterium]